MRCLYVMPSRAPVRHLLVLAVLVSAAVSLPACRRFNGYRTSQNDLGSAVRETRTDQTTRPAWDAQITRRGDRNFLLASLSRDRSYNREQITTTQKTTEKVYLGNNRQMEIISFALFVHDFCVIPVLDLFGRALTFDTGFLGPKYEQQRPHYLTRLWHWTGWFTFYYPVYDVRTKKTSEVAKTETFRNVKTLQPVRKREPLSTADVSIRITDAANQTLNSLMKKTDHRGCLALDLPELLATAPLHKRLTLSLIHRDGVRQVASDVAVARVDDAPYVVAAADLGPYQEAARQLERARNGDPAAMAFLARHHQKVTGKPQAAAQWLDSAALHYAQKDRHAIAFLLRALAAETHGGLTADRRAALDPCVQQLRKRIAFRVHIAEPAPAPKMEKITQQLRSTLGSPWPRLAPPCAVLCGATDGPDLVIQPTVRSFAIDTNRTVEKGTTTFQQGMKYEPNPGYKTAKAQYDAAVTGLQNAQKNAQLQSGFSNTFSGLPGWGASGAGLMTDLGDRLAASNLATAQQRLASAQAKLQATPPMTLVPNMVPFEYPIHIINVRADLQIEFRALQAAAPEAPLLRLLSKPYEVSDRVIKPDPLHNVPGDPLQLPPGAQVAERAVAQGADLLKAEVAYVLSHYNDHYAHAARQAKTNGATDDIIDNAVTFLLAAPADHPDREAVGQLLREALPVAPPQGTTAADLIARYGHPAPEGGRQ